MNIEKHPSVMFSRSMEEMLTPLKRFGINYFSYIEIDTSTWAMSGLTNQPVWAKHYLNNQYYNFDIHANQKEIFLDKSEAYYLLDYFCLDSIDYRTVYKDANEHGIFHILSVMQQCIDKGYCFFFGASENHYDINQFYINNIDTIRAFIQSFKDQLRSNKQIYKSLRESLEKKSIIISSNIENKDVTSYIKKPYMLAQSKRYYLDPLFPDRYLSQREMDCLFLLYRGHSNKQLSVKLKLSTRTVEQHVLNIKQKLNCRTLYQLGAVVASLNIGYYFNIKNGITT